MIDKLEMFIALARERHFGRAAEECGVTQPTLSAALKQLEEQLGVLLVLRGSRFQGLTPEGERVLDWARRLVADARTMQAEIKSLRDGLTGHFRLAVVPTALAYVPELTAPFLEAHPGVAITVLSRSSVEIRSLLENLEIQAGITYLENEPLGKVTQVPLYRERYCLVAARDSHLAERTSLTWKEVAELPLCLLTEDMQNRRIVDGYLAEAGTAAVPTLESDSIVSLIAHVRTGRWASIVPASLAVTFGEESIAIIPITEPDAGNLIGLVTNQREPHPPLIEAFLARVRAAQRKLESV